MSNFYLNVETVGNYIFERYIEDGVEKSRKVPYKPSLFTHTLGESKYKDIYGKYVAKKTFETLYDANQQMKRNKELGIETLGMDDYKLAYLSDTYPGVIDYDSSKVRVCNFDIEVTSPIGFPEPSQAMHPIDAITHYDSVDDKFYVFDLIDSCYGKVEEWDITKASLPESLGGDEVPQHILDRVVYMPFTDEKDMLMEYLNLFIQKPPVIITGWNVAVFDIPYVYMRMSNILGQNVANRLSPINRVQSKTFITMYGDEKLEVSIAGISTLDYIELYKKFSFTTQASYSLDYISESELGVGKLEYDGPIHKLRESNHQRYISYNIIDVERVLQIDDKRKFIDLCLSIGYYSKMQLQSVFSPIKTWDAILFNSLKEDNLVIPENISHVVQPYPGAFVKTPTPGAYKYILSFDLTSLYPSIIRQVNVSPETLIGQFNVAQMSEYIDGTAPRPSDVYSCSPSGWMYDKEKEGILPLEVTKVFNQRKDWKNKMLPAKRNTEILKKIKHDPTGHYESESKEKNPPLEVSKLDYTRDLTQPEIEYAKKFSESELDTQIKLAEKTIVQCDMNQIVRKLLINSLYGALGNVHFRFYDLRNATSITLFGQLALQWIERKVNEYLNKVLRTEGNKFVMYGDTDSIYVSFDALIEHVGEDKFKSTDMLVDFLDKFAREKLEPAIDIAYRELQEYMNNRQHLMFMDREAISCPPIGSKGLGGIWTAKKRYCLNVYDMEGTRFAEPYLKIMGLETQKSSTPKACQKALKESIRLMLQQGEQALHDYFKDFELEFKTLDYKTIASVSSANNIAKYDDNGYPGYKCPFHIRGILTYHRAITGTYAPKISEGDKVMVLPLRPQNPFNDTCIAWPSGSEIHESIKEDVLKWIDFSVLFEKTFVKPLAALTEAANIHYKKRASLEDLFDFF